jgi:hypothetical protein
MRKPRRCRRRGPVPRALGGQSRRCRRRGPVQRVLGGQSRQPGCSSIDPLDPALREENGAAAWPLPACAFPSGVERAAVKAPCGGASVFVVRFTEVSSTSPSIYLLGSFYRFDPVRKRFVRVRLKFV